MKKILPAISALALVAGLSVSFPAPASALGCLSGAAIGGVAGHLAGHHGLLGAAAGCAVGVHERHVDERQRREEYRDNHNRSVPMQQAPGYQGNYPAPVPYSR